MRDPTSAELTKADAADLEASRAIDIGTCRSLCLTLGPYRNLTTLTAATLFLHPNCQVLNHAGSRVFGNDEIDFLADYSRDRLDRFIQFAILISSKGRRGGFGGSITYSHAFDQRYPMRQTFERSGEPLTKDVIECLLWKESLRTSNRIRDTGVDLGAMLADDARVRFLMPIRNPMDCALSNLRTGHVGYFRGLDRRSSAVDVTHAVLAEILWFAELEERFPSRCFTFFDYELSHATLVRLATFLGLEPLEPWISDALAVMNTRPSYAHADSLVLAYQSEVQDRFGRFPELMHGLLRFS